MAPASTRPHARPSSVWGACDRQGTSLKRLLLLLLLLLLRVLVAKRLGLRACTSRDVRSERLARSAIGPCLLATAVLSLIPQQDVEYTVYKAFTWLPHHFWASLLPVTLQRSVSYTHLTLPTKA